MSWGGQDPGDTVPDFGDTRPALRNRARRGLTELVESLQRLAAAEDARGDIAAALRAQQQAVDLLRTDPDGRHLEYASALQNLAALHTRLHDTPRAIAQLEVAVDLLRAGGAPLRDVAGALTDLATAHANLALEIGVPQKLDQAIAGYREALTTFRAAGVETGNDSAAARAFLAAALLQRAPVSDGEPERLLLDALATWDLLPDPDLATRATALVTLADLRARQDHLPDAADLLREASDLQAGLHGRYHPLVAQTRLRQARLSVDAGDPVAALAALAEHREIESVLLAHALAAVTADQLEGYVTGLHTRSLEQIALLLRLRDHPGVPVAIASFELRRKRIGAELLARERLLRATPAPPALPAPDSVQPPLAAGAGDPLLDGVVSALPAGAVLLEYIRHVANPVTEAGTEERYAAVALDRAGVLGVVDLGPAAVVDDAVTAHLAAVTGLSGDRSPGTVGEGGGDLRAVVGSRDLGPVGGVPDDPRVAVTGAALRALVVDPLTPLVAGHDRLIVAPDGALVAVPLAILPDGDGHLLDRFTISYLGSGRDLVRSGTAHRVGPPTTEPVVVAAPAFDLGSDGRPRWAVADLPGTAEEGRLVAAMFEKAGLPVLLLMGPDAQGERLTHVHSPLALHIATHGFFEPWEPTTGDGEVRSTAPGEQIRHHLDPAMRSGLLLAGAGTWLGGGALPQGAGNGVLFAADVEGLDLAGTEMVVLSACETGLGQLHTGEGVHGLRRAFTIAGVRTVVMSLWRIPDAETRDLMEAFYRRMIAGEPRAEALRAAQMEVRSRRPSPFHWGGFVLEGEPGPLPRS